VKRLQSAKLLIPAAAFDTFPRANIYKKKFGQDSTTIKARERKNQTQI